MEKREGGDIIFLFEEDETWIRVYYVYIYIYMLIGKLTEC